MTSLFSVLLQLQSWFYIQMFYDENLYESRMETVITEEALLPERMQQLTLLVSEIIGVLQI